MCIGCCEALYWRVPKKNFIQSETPSTNIFNGVFPRLKKILARSSLSHGAAVLRTGRLIII